MEKEAWQVNGFGNRAEERGQTMLFVLVGLSIFLLAAAAFAVDLSNVWFHRQIAQDAADAACTAGVMDMLEAAQGGSSPKPNFISGTAFDCSATTPNTSPASAPVPCWYAATNGYPAKGLTAGKPSDEVRVTFPASVPGITAPPAGEVAAGFSPFIQVNVVDRVQSFFMGLVSGSKTMDVGALATCGVVAVPTEVPILVLDPRNESSVDLSGSGTISIYGGGTQGVQVNSSSTTAIQNKGTIDLSQGGPNHNGSSLGVTGAESLCCSFLPGANYWDPSTAAKPDPLAALPTPTKPSSAPATTSVANGVNGCQVASGTCDEYHAGYYAGGITVGVNHTAIFDPGLYYLDGSFTAGPNACVRPSTAAGDGTGGTIFYFNKGGAATLNVDADSGKKCTGTVALSALKCTAGSTIPGNLPAGGIAGNVLLAPCTGTYGDQLGGTETGGEQRGILFFQNRAVSASPTWGGNGASVAAGTMYFHQCVTSGADTGLNCNTTSAYTDAFSMHGNPGSSSYVIGSVITDQIAFNGTPSLIMDLNTNPSNSVLKASLLK